MEVIASVVYLTLTLFHMGGGGGGGGWQTLSASRLSHFSVWDAAGPQSLVT